MNSFTLYHADCVGMETNCKYPHKVLVTDDASLREAAARDYVCVQYKHNYRSNDNFTRSDCLGMDCDNDHSENSEDWVTPDHIRQAFPDTTFAVHFSRHHNIPKRGKPPRPKFHCFFPIEEMTDDVAYGDLKKRVNRLFPFFDTGALDAARFFFGTPDPKVAFYPGTLSLNDSLDLYYSDPEGAFAAAAAPAYTRTIHEGNRNATLSYFAGRVIKRYGDTEKAYNAFLEEAEKCEPPLEDAELATIWRSAQGFYDRMENESASAWTTVLNELKNRGVEDILIACRDNLSGFSTAIETVFPKTEQQLCVIHQIRSSTKYVSYKDIKPLMKDLKQIYGAPTLEDAEYHLEELRERWGKKYPQILRSWDANWAELSTYFKYPQEVRRLIYTTNAVEGFHRMLRKYTKTKTVYPTDDAVRKSVYLSIQEITRKWSMPVRDWGIIIGQLLVFFEGRLTGGRAS